MKTTENLVYVPPTKPVAAAALTPTSTSAPTTTSGVTPSRVTGSVAELSGQVCFKGGAYLPDLGDCSVVYQCVAGSLIKLFCRNGLFWNHMKQVCDTKCERRGYFTLEPPQPASMTTMTPKVTMRATMRPPTAMTPTTTPPVGAVNGYKTEIGCTSVFDYVKDQVSDQIFYRCIHGTLYRFTCQEGKLLKRNFTHIVVVVLLLETLKKTDCLMHRKKKT